MCYVADLSVRRGRLLSSSVQSLAFIGIAPPNLVTWGYLLDQAYANNAALNGWWWWILFPGLMIVVVAMPFVIVGFAIERAAFGGR